MALNTLRNKRCTKYIKYLTEEEYQRVLSWIDNRLSNNRPLQLCLYSCLYLGLRITEALTIKRSDFDYNFENFIYRPLKSKYDKRINRVVPNILRDKLIRYHNIFSSKYINDYLFFPVMNPKKNEHIQYNTVQFWIRKCRKEIGLNQEYFTCSDGKKLYRFSCHTLRHFAGYRYYKASNYNIEVVREMLGHEDIKTTMIYLNGMMHNINQKELINKAWE